jgi:MFS family permease
MGYNPLEVGLAFLPSCLIMGTLSLGYAEKLIMGYGAKKSLVTGLTLVVGGLLLFTQAPVDGNYWTQVMPVMVLLGTGAGVAFPALMTLSMSGATQSDAGLASGFVNTTVQVGGAIGLAVLATLAANHSDGLIAAGESAAEALNSGYHLAFVVGAVLTALAVLVAAFVITPDSERVEEQAEAPHEAPQGRGEPAYSEGA